MSTPRVRFAPSPTGPLHIGGLRTALFNYLFARHHGGTFVLRVEDTDQTRFVPGAEEFIREALDWCNIAPDESPWNGGEFGPYRQSERKSMYREYAERMIAEGNAYYAFDTPEELDAMRERLKAARVVSPQYNAITRTQMKNSLTLPADEVEERLKSGEPYVIRVKIPRKEEVRLNDMVRGWVMVHSSTLDDKVILKSDGMPTYHLANVVDDYLMKITHVIRGEEWLPSAPLHVLLYKFLGWEDAMPQFGHLPLLLKPDGNGKLSKRDGDRLGFPVFPLQWQDPNSGEISSGYREKGYLPDGFLNFLALLGWNPGDNQEIFTQEELIERFSMERVNKSGIKFDIEKAKWFNQQYLRNKPNEELAEALKAQVEEAGLTYDVAKLPAYAGLLKERATFTQDLLGGGRFFFEFPQEFEEKIVRKKWKGEVPEILLAYAEKVKAEAPTDGQALKQLLADTAEAHEQKAGKFMQPLRLALTGMGAGPDLNEILALLGPAEIAERIAHAVEKLGSQTEA